MLTMYVYYVAIKAMFLFGLVRTYVVYEPLQKHWLFLSLLYVAGLAFLSYVFLVAPNQSANLWLWKLWLGKTFVLTVVYFLLLRRFDEGPLFWLLLAAGLGLVWF